MCVGGARVRVSSRGCSVALRQCLCPRCLLRCWRCLVCRTGSYKSERARAAGDRQCASCSSAGTALCWWPQTRPRAASTFRLSRTLSRPTLQQARSTFCTGCGQGTAALCHAFTVPHHAMCGRMLTQGIPSCGVWVLSARLHSSNRRLLVLAHSVAAQGANAHCACRWAAPGALAPPAA